MSLKYRIKNCFDEIKWGFQRMFRGYDDRAVWNLNTWFLDVVPKILKEMEENRCGYPAKLTDKKWSDILNKMCYCFTEANEDTCTVKNKYEDEFERVWNEFEDQYGYFGALLPNAGERDEKDGHLIAYTPDCPVVNNKEWKKVCDNYVKDMARLEKYRDKKLHEGLQLFDKYFWNLWD